MKMEYVHTTFGTVQATDSFAAILMTVLYSNAVGPLRTIPADEMMFTAPIDLRSTLHRSCRP